MPPDPRPPYPRTPAYGEGVVPSGRRATDERARPGAVRIGDVPASRVAPGAVRLSLALALALNVVTLLGVLVLGWPAGNVFVIFWCENVVLGLVTLVRVATASDEPATRVASSLFFCVHYGIFCAVHLVFTYLVASTIGLDRAWPLFVLPVVLLLVRYGAELGTTWFGERGLRRSTPTRVAMGQPYPRVVVLHLAVLLAFALGVAGSFVSLPALGGHGDLLAVAVLLALKTVVDLATTRRALRAR